MNGGGKGLSACGTVAAFHLKFCHILQNVSRFRNISFLITEMHYTPTNTISKLLSSKLKKVYRSFFTLKKINYNF